MHFKRETSVAVSELQGLGSVSDSVKRMALSQDGHPTTGLQLKNPQNLNSHQPILTVLSTARDDFGSKYEVLREIGKGGFSTVYLCRDKRSNKEYAVKVNIH
jgi:hypothetical protein